MIYFILLFVILLLAECCGGSKLVRGRLRLKNIHWCVFAGIFLLIGLRNMSVGTDTVTYISIFWGETENWKGLVEFLSDNPEPLYTMLLMFCQLITDNYTVFLCVFAFPISYCFVRLMKTYSDDYLISVILFLVLGLMGFCMAGLRQSIAIAFTLMAYREARERKLLPFLVWCLLAYGFHNTAIVFVFIYPLVNRKISWKYWVASAIAVLLGVTRSRIVLQVASFFFTQDRYSTYGAEYTSSLNYTMFLIQFLLVVFCYCFRKNVLREEQANASLYHLAFVGLIFQAFVPILGEFFRISMYFSIYLCFLVPKTIKCMENKTIKRLAYLGLILVGIVYTFAIPTGLARVYQIF